MIKIDVGGDLIDNPICKQMKVQPLDSWYVINNVENIDSPALVIYSERIKKNIEFAINMVRGNVSRLRPHVKTHKSPDVTRLLIEAGVSKFKCATIAEADMLGSCKAPDVLFAYQPYGPKISRLINLIQSYPGTRFSCLVDNLTSAQNIAAEARKGNVEVPVFLDLNVGMNRTGIDPDDKAFDLLQQIRNIEGIHLVGLHAYDGHISDADFNMRIKKCKEAFAPVQKLNQALLASGLGSLTIVAGGSPTFPIHAQNEEVECSPGTFIFWDASYQQSLSEQPFLPAALVISRVISLPQNGIACLDLGHKSIAAENPLNRRVHFINAPDLEFVGQSEEHLVVRYPENQSLPIGEVLYGLPIHICPTCALYESAFIVAGHGVNGKWKIIARDRKINI